jgi:uncharacterized phiE125 gp8 family phage protein
MLKLKTAPTARVVTTAEAKQHARVYANFTADDSYLAELSEAAAFKFEEETGFYLREAEYEWTPEATALRFELPLRPYLAESLTVMSGETELVDGEDFTLTVNPKGIASLVFTTAPDSPVFTFSVGFAEGEAPALAKLAIKTLVAHWYNNREAFAEKALGPVAGTWESVIRNFRLA